MSDTAARPSTGATLSGPPSPTTLRALAVTTTVLGGVSALAITVGPGLSDRVSYLDSGWPWHGFSLAFLVTGAVIAAARPRHRIGWMFLGLGIGGTVGGALTVLALALNGQVSSWWITGGEAAATATMSLFVPLILLTFPTGRLLSPRWAWAAGLALLAAAAGTVAALLSGGWGGSPEDAAAPSPLRGVADGFGATLSTGFYLLFPLAFVAGAVSSIVRYRRSRGEERAQLRWLAPAGIALIVVFPVMVWGPAGDGQGGSVDYTAYDLWTETVVVAAICLIPIGAGVAVLRYRLYDIDIVISRSLVVAVLAAFVTGVYIAIVAGVGYLVHGGDRPGPVLSVAATAVVAVAFQPVRVRVRRLVDRLVYGQRATPYEVLAGFAHPSGAGLLGTREDPLVRVAALLAGGTGATEVTVWLRVGERLRAMATCPEDRPPGTELPLPEGTDVVVPGADRATPVYHDGELLGLLSLTKSHGEQIGRTDEQLLSGLAGGLGLMLRNRRLTAELSDRVDALAASRQRVVTTQDEVRRKLGRDLRVGAQEPLTSCGHRLAELGETARRAGAAKTTPLLAQVGADTNTAVAALRDFAEGVYPPVLEADGIATALAAATRANPLPVTVQAPDLGRYPRDVESAVYFCALEALQNVTKYAHATSATVHLHERADTLELAVVDDGVGFDPDEVTRGAGLANMRDRVAILGGTVTITARRGNGTTVRGRVPVGARPVVEPLTTTTAS